MMSVCSRAIPAFLGLMRRGIVAPVNVSSCKYQTGMGDDADKTTIEVMNKKLELGLMIDSYSQVGFRLNNGISLLGPIALFTRTVLSWRVTTAEDINEENLSLFYLLEPKLDVLVIGYGNKKQTDKGIHKGSTISGINSSILASLQRRKIYLEVLPTDLACTTYNFLMAEGRFVAAALIPPEMIAPNDMDVITTKHNNNELFDYGFKE